jgi:hypothetical protein
MSVPEPSWFHIVNRFMHVIMFLPPEGNQIGRLNPIENASAQIYHRYIMVVNVGIDRRLFCRSTVGSITCNREHDRAN